MEHAAALIECTEEKGKTNTKLKQIIVIEFDWETHKSISLDTAVTAGGRRQETRPIWNI